MERRLAGASAGQVEYGLNMASQKQQQGEHRERRLVVAITGASGSVYATEFLKQAVRFWDRVWLTTSSNALVVARHELGLNGFDPSTDLGLGELADRVTVLSSRDLAAPPSSGSCRYDGMVIVPCSMGTVGRVANGVSSDLISRVADVCLKERRKLVMVPRETPLSSIHLRNMLTAAEAGATILPAAPGMYHRPQSVQEMVDFVTARILQSLGVDQDLMDSWGEGELP